MTKLVCARCQSVFDDSHDAGCPKCGAHYPHVYDFENSENHLRENVPRVLNERKGAGLDGLVGGLDSIVVNVESGRFDGTVLEMLGNTGMLVEDAFSSPHGMTCVLGGNEGPRVLITTRDSEGPFREINDHPRSSHLPDTRLETMIFVTSDVQRYFEIQSSRGVEFMTDGVIQGEGFSFVQTKPSRYTGNSIGLIQRHEGRSYRGKDSLPIQPPEVEGGAHLENIGRIDHAATRIHAQDRDPAILEFMSLTNYDFDFAIYVKTFNSITSVARLSADDFALVFTSGISPHGNGGEGPTEKFVHEYGARVHHIAFRTGEIEDTYLALKESGQRFLLELVGSPEEGLKQTFTIPSQNTLLVNEYIHRYEGFDGFFAKHNVAILTEATGKQ